MSRDFNEGVCKDCLKNKKCPFPEYESEGRWTCRGRYEVFRLMKPHIENMVTELIEKGTLKDFKKVQGCIGEFDMIIGNITNYTLKHIQELGVEGFGDLSFRRYYSNWNFTEREEIPRREF